MAPNTDSLLYHLHMKWQETPLEVGNKKRKMFSLLTYGCMRAICSVNKGVTAKRVEPRGGGGDQRSSDKESEGGRETRC